MGMAASFTLGPESGRLLIKTGRVGLAAKAGHDLTIEATRWRALATIDTANPADSSVAVDAEVDSFEVREGTGGAKPLTPADREEIKRTLREKILHTAQHPTITFRSRRVEGSAEAFRVEGDLTITGVTHPVIVNGELTDSHVRGGATISQSRWGIRPYSAFFGALKLSDEVEVQFDIALPSSV
jgi:polyisoprenoid-binding protein YceI